MAAQIFDIPEEIKVPEINFANFNLKEYNEQVEKFYDELKQHLIDLGYKDDYVGELIRFPVADGNAEYMVFNLKPVMLVHIPIGDAWEFQYVERLTKADVVKKIKQRKALAEMFGKKTVNK